MQTTRQHFMCKHNCLQSQDWNTLFLRILISCFNLKYFHHWPRYGIFNLSCNPLQIDGLTLLFLFVSLEYTTEWSHTPTSPDTVWTFIGIITFNCLCQHTSPQCSNMGLKGGERDREEEIQWDRMKRRRGSRLTVTELGCIAAKLHLIQWDKEYRKKFT